MGILPVGKEKLSGQALLIVLLGMSVVLTVVLSVVSRTVTDISISTYEEEAQRAFDAAEAGVEEALLTGEGVSLNLDSQTGTFVDTTIGAPVSSDDEFVGPTEIFSGESTTFWFVSHDPATGDLKCGGEPCLRSRRLEICWGNDSTIDSETPAIELSVFYDDGGGNPPPGVDDGDFSGVKVARKVYDPNPGRIASNNFDAASNCSRTIDGRSDLAFSTGIIRFGGQSGRLDIPCNNTRGCLLMAKVRMFYNETAHPVGLWARATGGSSLPAQGTQIESVGSSGNSTRKVNVFESYPEPPLIFDSAIFSFNDLSK